MKPFELTEKPLNDGGVMFTFVNDFGEPWEVTINAKRTEGNLSCSDLDKSAEIYDDGILSADMLLSSQEFNAIREAWRRGTGRTLRGTIWMQLYDIISAAFAGRCPAAPSEN